MARSMPRIPENQGVQTAEPIRFPGDEPLNPPKTQEPARQELREGLEVVLAVPSMNGWRGTVRGLRPEHVEIVLEVPVRRTLWFQRSLFGTAFRAC